MQHYILFLPSDALLWDDSDTVRAAEIESGFIAKADRVPYRCSPVSSCAAPPRRRRRWVGVKDSTRNGRHDPKCPSGRRLRMIQEDTGTPLTNLCPDGGR
ncbi:hypothetical protein TNCV_3683801 [Trichonephila clavipes]|nr:hypothetical protein TNCV_3683801 [Trichonephila clavipes]